jgi:hypothetical protein
MQLTGGPVWYPGRQLPCTIFGLCDYSSYGEEGNHIKAFIYNGLEGF